jgi:hypothetical protein
MRQIALALLVAFTPAVLDAQTPEPRRFLVAVDDLQLDFRHTPRLRDSLGKAVTALAREGDTWTVVSTGTSSVSLAPTRNVAAVRDTIRRFTGNRLTVRDHLDAFGNPDLATEVRHRWDVSNSTIARAIERLTSSGAGPIVVLYLGDGSDSRLLPPLTGVIDAALQAQAPVVVISPIEARAKPGVRPEEWAAYVAATRESLRVLAEQTGGITVFSKDELEPALAALAFPRP